MPESRCERNAQQVNRTSSIEHMRYVNINALRPFLKGWLCMPRPRRFSCCSALESRPHIPKPHGSPLTYPWHAYQIPKIIPALVPHQTRITSEFERLRSPLVIIYLRLVSPQCFTRIHKNSSRRSKKSSHTFFTNIIHTADRVRKATILCTM